MHSSASFTLLSATKSVVHTPSWCSCFLLDYSFTMCSNLMMGWWRPINRSIHHLGFSSSPLPIPGKYLQFYPKFSGSRQKITFVFQKKPSKLFFSVICTSGFLKLLFACVCPWADRVILFFSLKVTESHLPASLWMQFRADCHNPRCASCLQTVTGLSLPTVVCTFGYKSYLKRKSHLILKRDNQMLSMGALWAAKWAKACKPFFLAA